MKSHHDSELRILIQDFDEIFPSLMQHVRQQAIESLKTEDQRDVNEPSSKKRQFSPDDCIIKDLKAYEAVTVTSSYSTSVVQTELTSNSATLTALERHTAHAHGTLTDEAYITEPAFERTSRSPPPINIEESADS